MMPPVLMLTDRTQLPPGRTLGDVLRACTDVGLEAVVVRELDLPEVERQAIADAAIDLGLTVIAAQRPLEGANGLHLAARQPAHDARGAALTGRSCHDAAEIDRAVAAGVDYVTVSPVWLTRSKPGYGPALGEAGLRAAIRRAAGIPVYALGGIDQSTAPQAIRAGAHGVAVMGALMRAIDPAAVLDRIKTGVATAMHDHR